MIEERKVRSADGLIPCHTDEEHGFTIQGIREWRAAQLAAGRPSAFGPMIVSPLNRPQRRFQTQPGVAWGVCQ